MHIIQLIYVVLFGLQLNTEKITTDTQGDSLMCSRLTSVSESNTMSIALYYQGRRARPHKTSSFGNLQQLLLILSGTVEVNPGPSRIKFPCVECGQAVKTENSIACDACNCWFHSCCTSISEVLFQCYIKDTDLEWICTKCAVQDISSDLFNSSVSSNDLTVSDCENTVKSKAKNLRILTFNLQSIWNKRTF